MRVGRAEARPSIRQRGAGLVIGAAWLQLGRNPAGAFIHAIRCRADAAARWGSRPRAGPVRRHLRARPGAER